MIYRLLFIIPLLAGALHADGVKPQARLMIEADDSISKLFKTGNNHIAKQNFKTKANGERVLRSHTLFALDYKGRPRGCRIYDGQGTELYRVRYGYRKTDGKLISEEMFDSRVNRVDPKTGEAIPVKKLFYKYDSTGNRSRPFSFTTIQGKKVEEVFRGKVFQELKSKGLLNKNHSTFPTIPADLAK